MRPSAEDERGINAQLADPSGALRQATREVRRQLGDPPPTDPESLDVASVIEAVLGPARPDRVMLL